MIIDDKIFPDFIIAGAQKCGSTSLAKWLDEHPDLVCSNPKEPKYFNSQEVCDANKGFAEFFSSDDLENSKLIFEATQMYMFDRDVAKRIKDVCGAGMKFIFIVKDPVARAVSAYFHTFKYGNDLRDIEDVFNFDGVSLDQIESVERQRVQEAIENGKIIDIDRYSSYEDSLLPFLYVSNSLYRTHLRRFVDLFGENNILVLSLGSAKQNPRKFFDIVCNYIGVKNFVNLPDIDKKHNKTLVPRFMTIPYIRRRVLLIKIARKITGFGVRIGLRSLLFMDKVKAPNHVLEKLEGLLTEEKEWVESLGN